MEMEELMGEIKSALEKALERTKNISAARASAAGSIIQNEGRKSVFRFIENDGSTREDLESLLDKYSDSDKEQLVTGMVKVLNANLVMPSSRDYSQERTDRIRDALMLCSKEQAPYIQELFGQLTGFFSQYSTNKDMLKENIREQLAPQIEERQRKISEKLGMDVDISVENDPDFKKALSQAQNQLDEKYSSILMQVKSEIENRILSH
ncbi:MAG: hypothetical protein MJ215_07735 [Spirochaetia bacterium]|nr:hypothetical protein [Spirochaetia bacterium]